VLVEDERGGGGMENEGERVVVLYGDLPFCEVRVENTAGRYFVLEDRHDLSKRRWREEKLLACSLHSDCTKGFAASALIAEPMTVRAQSCSYRT